MIGGVTGAIAVGAIGTSSLCAKEECGVTFAPLMYGAVGLAGGAIVGGVIGALWRTTRWQSVSIARLRLAPGIRPRGP